MKNHFDLLKLKSVFFNPLNQRSIRVLFLNF